MRQGIRWGSVYRSGDLILQQEFRPGILHTDVGEDSCTRKIRSKHSKTINTLPFNFLILKAGEDSFHPLFKFVVLELRQGNK